MARGYLNDPKATDEVYRSGWFHTGDIGYWRRIGERTYFFIHGRKKEIIIKGGVNISPVAVEDALLQALPELAAAYVVGEENERWGEDVCAVVILRDSPAPEEQMEAAERIVVAAQAGDIAGLSPYEAPCRVIPVVRDRLPMTSSGKVQRSVLRGIVSDMVQRGDQHGLEP
jgi:acyl-CoA synthetase (AMP-forming)/AMP-acid ligase II